MGFGTQQQLGNRAGINNQTTFADLFGGGGVGFAPQQQLGGGNINPLPPQLGGGGNISLPGLEQDGNQNQLFALLQQLMGGGGKFGMQPPQPGVQPGLQPGIQQPPFGGDFNRGGVGQITPPGLGQQLDGNTILSALTAQPNQLGGGAGLTNPFGNLINQRFIR